MYCVHDVKRCPYKSQVTTINQVRDQCLQFCYNQSSFQDDWKKDMYSSPCGRFCQQIVDQTVKQYGYSPCEKKIQPAVHWFQYP
jgi:hypothetical protein